ncbi:hypothetical protein N7499_011020 [Penicillium canescens]|nr:hypothetical protein N7499_011020 [Penicillium canescens]
MAEKAATKNFMEDTGYSYRIFWKNIFDIREAGVNKILLYRIKEFDSFCRGYSKTSETLLVDKWAVNPKEEIFRQRSSKSISTDIFGIPHGDESVYEGGSDKSAFITLLPKDDEALFVSSIVPICEGDFLDIFAGTIRLSEDFNVTHGGNVNVCLRWEAFYGDNTTEPCISWRVSVKATKHIMPFDPIVRAAA